MVAEVSLIKLPPGNKPLPEPMLTRYLSPNGVTRHQCVKAMCKVENGDVVGAAPTGDAPTSCEWSTNLLPTKVHLILQVWRKCHYWFQGIMSVWKYIMIFFYQRRPLPYARFYIFLNTSLGPCRIHCQSKQVENADIAKPRYIQVNMLSARASLLCFLCVGLNTEWYYKEPQYFVSTGVAMRLDSAGDATIWVMKCMRWINQLSNVIMCPVSMMVSSNGNIFRVTGRLCGDSHFAK